MPSSPTKETWNDEYTLILVRAITASILANRSSFYQVEGLENVNEHGGDRINKKIQTLFKNFCGSFEGGQGLVEEVLKELKKNGGGGGNGGGKKRKTKNEN